MMRLGRRASLLVVFLLLTSAAFRSFAVLRLRRNGIGMVRRIFGVWSELRCWTFGHPAVHTPAGPAVSEQTRSSTPPSLRPLEAS